MEVGQNEVETKLCSNCEQMIEKPKFMLHEAYCLRHMYKCKCGEVVCKAEKDDHEEEKHVSVKCKHCSFEAMKHEFGDHEANCDKKPKECQFCEQMILFDDFFNHVNFCGSKTRTCEFCMRNVMMRNQKYHQEEECAKFIRDDYEKEQQEKIKALEEEEKRADKLKEMQAARRKMKEDKEKAEMAKKAARPKPKAAPVPSHAPAPVKSKPAGPGRVMPDYFSKPKSYNSGASKKSSVPKKPSSGASSSYAPKYRGVDKKPIPKEKEEVKKKSPQQLPTRPQKPVISSSNSANISEYAHNHMDEIPPELLNQIYSEDLDMDDVERIQQQEFQTPRDQVPSISNPPRRIDNQPQQLLGPDADMYDYDMRAENRPQRLPSPPLIRNQAPPVGEDQSENELIQRAIAESLKQGNPRMHPMDDNLDSTMTDPEMLEAIQRSMQDR